MRARRGIGIDALAAVLAAVGGVRGRGRRGVGALLALALAAGLAACQAVPSEGPVHEGLASLNQGEQPVQFNPEGPAAGADQEDIVRGFIRAATSSVDDYAIAREFLAPAYAAQWQPEDGVFIDEGIQPYASPSENVGELSLSGLATVDSAGTLSPLPTGPETVMRFEFTQVGGEWRISSAPNGVILDRISFSAVWTNRQLYFLTPDNRLVAETRWFLNRATLSTQIISGLLDGPNEADAQALRTGFPSGTTLASDSVPVNGGIARIEFSPELLTSEPANMEQVKQQIAASLQSVPGVTGFEISVNGAIVDSASVTVPDNQTRNVENLVTTVIRGDGIGTLSGGEIVPLPRIGDRIAELNPDAVTLSADRSSAAVRHRGESGSAVTWVSQNDTVTIDLRRGLFEPALDRFGYVWSYAESDPDRILVQLPGSSPELLRLPGLEDREPLAVRVSPGGNRLAVLVEGNDGMTAVFVIAIVRDADQRPVGLGEIARRELVTSGSPVDLDWVDETRIVTLSRAGAGVKVTLAPLGQLPSDIGTVADAAAVSGGGSRSLIRVLDGDGRLFGPQGSGWQLQSEDVRLIVRSG
ncbi:Lipoprotein LpqB [Leucobacter soli]|uniref:Lipoprotein LpqB n=2 Tax=Leucobacter soli TaxID=2812850 RepID=A0A916K3X4_9MICO|nr:LpqB family beta-propeller domain-containing protein [Leucobacter soli]CAG7621732.1 Lipoprotein LpqB [Leucobacter soli]